MSREGIKELQHYIGADDKKVIEPLFIAQYLLCPINTIVDEEHLALWMMKDYLPTFKPGLKLLNPNDQTKARF